MSGFITDETPWEGGRISSRIFCLRADNPSPMTYVGTNTFVVAEPEGSRCVVVDPAPAGQQVQCILAYCEEHGLEVAAIVVTHDHFDHTEGIPELVAATGVSVYASRLDEVRTIAPEAELHQLGEGLLEIPGVPALEVIALPGHSDDSIGLLLDDEKALLTGDVLFRQGPTVVFYPDGDLGDYLHTLDVLEGLVAQGRAKKFLPAHGYPIEDPLSIIEATRQHRMERLEQIKQALAQGTPPDPDALFDVVYQGVDPRLKPASVLSIQAQLKYLGLLD